jgi:Beta-lactamase enzyme family
MTAFAKAWFGAVFILSSGASLVGSENPAENNSDLLMPLIQRQDYIQKPESDSFMYKLLANYSQYFDSILARKDELNVQIIFTQVDRKKKGKPSFTDHYFNHNPDHYFYPASTVKLPIALLALQKLNELKIPGLDKYSTMITGSDGGRQTEIYNDPTAADGRPTIAHYIKKILLVSDNDAFNRLYEFLGQEYINNSLHKMGYTETQIIHRLSISLTDDENRRSNPIMFLDTNGKLLYEKPAETSKLVYSTHDIRMGKGYIRGSELVNEPFDFTMKNRFPLNDLHQIVRSIMFPDAVPDYQRFNLTKDDYDFLRKYMSMRPGESRSPVYDTAGYWDNYVKMIFYGTEKTPPEKDIRIFSKTGTAYGFLIESCYFADFKNNIEFMVSAIIYCNSDGIFNDDKYDYQTLGYPFFKNLGRVLYEYELKRSHKYPSDLNSFRFDYTR